MFASNVVVVIRGECEVVIRSGVCG